MFMSEHYCNNFFPGTTLLPYFTSFKPSMEENIGE
jgi:hypothetical protein